MLTSKSRRTRRKLLHHSSKSMLCSATSLIRMRKRPLLSSSEDMSICAGISANGHTCIKLMERSSDVSCAETWRMFPPSKFQRLHRLLAPCRRNSTAGFASPCCQRYTHQKVSRIHGKMPRGTSQMSQPCFHATKQTVSAVARQEVTRGNTNATRRTNGYATPCSPTLAHIDNRLTPCNTY